VKPNAHIFPARSLKKVEAGDVAKQNPAKYEEFKQEIIGVHAQAMSSCDQDNGMKAKLFWFYLAAISLLLGGWMMGCNLKPASFPILAPTSTKACYWGNFITKEVPEQSLFWQAKFTETSLRAAKVRALAFGETFVCSIDGKREDGDLLIQFVELELTIPVSDLDNTEVLTSSLNKIVDLIESQQKIAPVQSVLLTFTTGESRTRTLEFGIEQIRQLEAQGDSGSVLLEKLEKK
jgi:hypothetical protein